MAGSDHEEGWHALDRHGATLTDGRRPTGPGAVSPAAALRAAPVVCWPIEVASGDRRLALGQALGPGGDEVEDFLEDLVGDTHSGPDSADAIASSELARLAASTPAGTISAALAVLDISAGARAAVDVEPRWLAEVAEVRQLPRDILAGAGRLDQLEAALHVSMLVAAGCLARGDDGPSEQMASGGQLWLMVGVVAWALASPGKHPFQAWGQLLTRGIWPIGPSHGRLVVSRRR